MFWIFPIGGLLYFAFGTQTGKNIFGTWRKLLPNLLMHSPLGSTQTLAAQVASNGSALPAARTLYNYLKANGNAQTPTLAALVTKFQAASNADSVGSHLVGMLSGGGLYDAATSGALTVYTHDPIPASPGVPPPPPPTQAVIMNALIPGAAASSGFNLYTYLKAKKPRSGDTYTQLVKQFQTDVNTDPKFPGPMSADGLPKVITSPLALTGVYDTETEKALTVVSYDNIPV